MSTIPMNIIAARRAEALSIVLGLVPSTPSLRQTAWRFLAKWDAS